jgi:hypothetical protein
VNEGQIRKNTFTDIKLIQERLSRDPFDALGIFLADILLVEIVALQKGLPTLVVVVGGLRL